jgi:thiol-disulfide isomerase/thioredoxin
MQRYLKILFWAVALLLGTNAFAAPQLQSQPKYQTQPLLRGSYQKIIAAHAGKPFIVAMWSVNCTHCGADLEIFGRLAKKYADFDLVLISTDSPEQEAVIISSLKKYNLGLESSKHKRAGKVESWIFADSYAERLRFEVDTQWYGELPRTYFFDAAGKARGVSGVLDENTVEQWVKAH